MSDVVTTILPEVRTALLPILGGMVRKGTETTPQPVPSWWLQSIGSSPLGNLQDAEVLELHVWTKSRADMEEAEDAVSHLRGYRISGITYTTESIVKVQEDVEVFHMTLTLTAKTFATSALGVVV